MKSPQEDVRHHPVSIETVVVYWLARWVRST